MICGISPYYRSCLHTSVVATTQKPVGGSTRRHCHRPVGAAQQPAAYRSSALPQPRPGRQGAPPGGCRRHVTPPPGPAAGHVTAAGRRQVQGLLGAAARLRSADRRAGGGRCRLTGSMSPATPNTAVLHRFASITRLSAWLGDIFSGFWVNG